MDRIKSRHQTIQPDELPNNQTFFCIQNEPTPVMTKFELKVIVGFLAINAIKKKKARK